MKNIVFPALILVLLVACSSDNDSSMSCTGDYDETALLSNMADQLILPSVQGFNEQADLLNSDIVAFLNTAQEAELERARNSFVQAYNSYQQLAQFMFGPAEQLNFRERVNNFPVNENQLLTSIENEDYDFSLSMQYDQGLPAMDFLLFGQGTETETVQKFANDEKYAEYLRQVSADVLLISSQLSEEWQNYRQEFIDRTGTAAGASLAQLVNSWNEEYEITKRDRIGIPSGQVTLGFTNPDKVEAFYSGISIDLLRTSLESAGKVFQGISFEGGQDGPGLNDLLDHVGAEKDGQALSQIIDNQYELVLEKLQNLQGETLSELVDSNKPGVEELYVEASRQVLYKKTDLPSVLCIAITYVDNPSDSD